MAAKSSLNPPNSKPDSLQEGVALRHLFAGVQSLNRNLNAPLWPSRATNNPATSSPFHPSQTTTSGTTSKTGLDGHSSLMVMCHIAESEQEPQFSAHRFRGAEVNAWHTPGTVPGAFAFITSIYRWLSGLSV